MELLDWFRAEMDPEYVMKVADRNSEQMRARCLDLLPPQNLRPGSGPDPFTQVAQRDDDALAARRYIASRYGWRVPPSRPY